MIAAHFADTYLDESPPNNRGGGINPDSRILLERIFSRFEIMMAILSKFIEGGVTCPTMLDIYSAVDRCTGSNFINDSE